nr:LOW QUALITY PROTEIN: von Willebrand factor-like [Ciona intestinalis]|eukprot:XP_026693636.1 LOW QUALITY PROTEIN: von Willebrand factor-like [Ciona intestinalis]
MKTQFVFMGCLVLASITQGISESQNEQRNKRNIGELDIPDSLLSIQHQSQSQVSVSCDPPCANGACVGENQCKCEEGYSGPACNEFECTESCGHGKCVAPNTCECNTGWGGESCHTATCDDECLNGGSCSAPNTCTCLKGWSGDNCGSAVCDVKCANGGTCDSPNVCLCKQGYQGTLCQIAQQPGCKFPFEYNGELYMTCTTVDATDGQPWCSTTTAFEGDKKICDFTSMCSAAGQKLEIPGECGKYYECADDMTVSVVPCPAGTVFNALVGGCDTADNVPMCKDDASQGPTKGEDSTSCPAPTHSSNVCSYWEKENFYTFDGALFASSGRCNYQLVSDCVGNTFDISLSFTSGGNPSLKLTSQTGVSVVVTGGKAYNEGEEIAIPSLSNGFSLYKLPNTDYTIINSSAGFAVAWSGNDNFFIAVHNKNLVGHLCGLCGNFNGFTVDDMVPKYGETPTTNVETLMDSWLLASGEECTTGTSTDYCGLLTTQQLSDIAKVCAEVVTGLSFTSCNVPTSVLEETCVRDLCQCEGDYKDCLCASATHYSKLCVATGANVKEWRTDKFCPKSCPNGMVYSECGTACPRTCKNKGLMHMCASLCVDGCFCPAGTILDVGGCVAEEECSCSHLGEVYSSGQKRTEDCRECTCNGGSWSCTDLMCAGECSATGDPHYQTFDGSSYSFNGDCRYVLATDSCGSGSNYTFAVVVENVKCEASDSGSCTKSATIVIKNALKETKYKLKQEGVVGVDENDVTLPYTHGDISIMRLSSMMVQVKTSNGIEVDWDGEMRLYIRLDPLWRNRVCGLCGNFNGKATDDMKTPQSIVETNPASFGNSWKVSSECAAVPSIPESCSANQEKIEEANQLCDVIKSDVFKPCHQVVDYELHYSMCRSDVCGCSGDNCMCSSLSDNARKCVEKGVVIQWRSNTTCGVTCESGLEYRECGGDCVSKCSTLGGIMCDRMCHPGCYCPQNLYLNDDGTCVEMEKCGCIYQGVKYTAGEAMETSSTVCECKDGLMTCHDKQEAPSCEEPLVYIDCVSSSGTACQDTCQSKKTFCMAESCVAGCGCPEGTIKDENTNTCVKPDQCSCTHNGQVYEPNSVMSPDSCNDCTCVEGGWSCTEMACPAECSAVGDPHFTSFDGLRYNFQGACSYVMSQDFCNNKTGGFRVVVENIPCGNNGVTCTKSVTVHLYNVVIKLTKGDGEPVVSESVSIGSPAPPSGFQYNIRKGSIYYIVETNNGLSVLWNKENAAKVQLQPNYMGQVCGLCGNYDGDTGNDFQTRDGDIAVNPNDFGNDWKTDDTCPDGTRDPNPCLESPERAPWAEKKCAIINSEVFAECHAKVDPTHYYDNCMYDTCGCNFGGDCECFCTAVAVYAQECAAAGVCINWRNNEVCPVMCEVFNPGFGSSYDNETCEWKYNACGNPCPPTCDNPNPTNCPWESLEGCYVSCKDDEVWDEIKNKCIPKSECPVVTTTTPVITTTTTEKTTTTTEVTTTTPEPEIITTTPEVTHPDEEITTTTPKWCNCVDSDGIAHSPGETWPLRNDESLCVDLTCVEEAPGVCKTESVDTTVKCTAENKPTCLNGFPAVAVTDGCSCQWECQCYCFGQGDPHFFTFDGKYYPFQGNCTFVLSRDMNEHHSNHPHDYEIWMENEACPEAPETTCTRKMTIRYGPTHVVLYKNYTFTVNGGNLKHRAQMPYTFGDIRIELRGFNLFYVTIPDLGITLTYTGLDYSWSLIVPYSVYFNKTEGLCGVCNNDQGDDFTTRKGTVVKDIEIFGESWLVYNESKHCFKEDNKTCFPAAPECDIITSDVFKDCHALVDPEVYLKICRFDTAQCGNYSYCEALYGYARICQHAGVCVDWRTDSICPMECGDDEIYMACQPNCEQTCDNFISGEQCASEEVVEGCFCPPGTVLDGGECVAEETCTDCVDADGNIFGYGESWVSENASCTICSCMEGQNVVCTNKPCSPGWTDAVPSCHSCFVPELERGSDPCCPTYKCVCNYELGKGDDECDVVTIPTCDPGYIPIQTNPGKCIPSYECTCNASRNPCPVPPTCGELEHLVSTDGECCPTHKCVCNECPEKSPSCGVCQNTLTTVDKCDCKHYTCENKGVCNINGTEKLPGDSWNTDPCTTCTCHETSVDNDGCYNVGCVVMSCSTYCPPCSTYTPVAGQCCGMCVQTACSVADENNSTQCKPIGDHWQDLDKCISSICVANPNGHTTVTTAPITCPPVAMPTCTPCYKIATYTEDCCEKYHCIPDDVCCLSGPAIKLPGETWEPDACNECQCTNNMNHTSGFHVVDCSPKPCPPFDIDDCESHGGQSALSDDGCCMHCVANVCVDAKNQTHSFGETWYPDVCTICSCVAGHEIVCNPVTCPPSKQAPMNCAPCEVPLRRLSSDPCCPQYDCVCNYELIKGEPNCDAVPVPKCPPGYVASQTNVGQCIPDYDCFCNKSRNPCPEAPECPELHELVTTETECCPLYGCVCKKCNEAPTSCSPCQDAITTIDACGCRHVTCQSKNICYVDDVAHLPGDIWNPDVCTQCVCQSDVTNPDTACHVESCFAQSCDPTCPPCHDYVVGAGECCGTCVQRACQVAGANGTVECKNVGDNWWYESTCEQYMCTTDNDGNIGIVEVAYACPVPEVPTCSSCYKLESYVEGCCSKLRCVQENVCCADGMGKLPGSTWAPDACHLCQCTEDKDLDTGFLAEQCYHNPCPPFDSDACVANGGTVISSDDGCCLKCQETECFECDKRMSTKPEYMLVDGCASNEPVSLSYCDGFCRGHYFWTDHGAENDCSCCNPTSTATRVVSMKCKNGTEVQYSFTDVLSCGCTATCTPNPPTVTPAPETPAPTTTAPEAPVPTTTVPVKPTPTTEETGSGETTVPEAPVTTTTVPVKPTPNN